MVEPNLEYWQKVLRLQDWRIKIEHVPHWKMDDKDVMAQIYIASKKKQAKLELAQDGVDPEGIHMEVEGWDEEVNFVHELLHIHFKPFEAKEGTAKNTAQEVAIHAISSALVALKRGDV